VDIRRSVSETTQPVTHYRDKKNPVRFFPHEIADLSIALDFLLLPDGLIQDSSQWALRYVVLIWLALICMIPFDLAQFDDIGRIGHTAAVIETTARSFLGKAGVERDGASLLLSRLFMRCGVFLFTLTMPNSCRKDTSLRFQPFLQWSKHQLGGDADIVTVGRIITLCWIVF